jgi:CRISPR/Cas system CMR subunit Cmr6 (Cas7 group RAMP superfamily)
MSLDAAATAAEIVMEEIEPTTADEFNEEYLKEEVSEIEKELEKNLNTLGRTVQQLMEKMDDMNQNTVNLKHRIQVLETRVGVIH